MPEITETLKERGARYGSFEGHSLITQRLKWAMHEAPRWSGLADDQKECLEMIAHKIGRILNGDPNYHDSWHDIVGYTKLVADRLEKDGKSEYNVSCSTNSKGRQGAEQDGSKEIPNRNVVLERKETKSEVGREMARGYNTPGLQPFNGTVGRCYAFDTKEDSEDRCIGDATGYPD